LPPTPRKASRRIFNIARADKPAEGEARQVLAGALGERVAFILGNLTTLVALPSQCDDWRGHRIGAGA